MGSAAVATHCPYCALQCGMTLPPQPGGMVLEPRDRFGYGWIGQAQFVRGTGERAVGQRVRRERRPARDHEEADRTGHHGDDRADDPGVDHE